MKLKDANAITGGGIQTGNGKMPGTSYATDPFRCETGSKLRKVEGTTCSRCYACKLAAFRPSVAKGYANRHDAMLTASLDFVANGHGIIRGSLAEAWVDAMAFLIEREARKSGVFFHRWFDAGDLPHPQAIRLIEAVARRTPEVQHWVPTREGAWLYDYLKPHVRDILPRNLVIRISATKVDGKAPGWAPLTSGVHKASEPEGAHICPAPSQGGKCGECRACWSPQVRHVSYHLH